jgi:hypothetical protein
VSLLASLARFLTEEPVEDEGRAFLGDLTLPTLEKLAEIWAHELDVFWIEAKQAISKTSAGGVDIPDYLGIDVIAAAFAPQPDDSIAAVRDRMQQHLDRCRGFAAGQPTDVLDRIAVVFDGRSE